MARILKFTGKTKVVEPEKDRLAEKVRTDKTVVRVGFSEATFLRYHFMLVEGNEELGSFVSKSMLKSLKEGCLHVELNKTLTSYYLKHVARNLSDLRGLIVKELHLKKG